MKKHLYLLIAASLLAFRLQAQPLEQAKIHIDSLCAPYMHGRGYSFGGDKQAARYIAQQFATAGLMPPSKSGYFQPFSLSANVFEGKLHLKLGKQTLEAGEDFIPHPLSGSAAFAGKIFWLDSTHWQQPSKLPPSLEGLVLAYTQAQEQQLPKLPQSALVKLFKAKAHLVAVPKLTHSFAQGQYPLPMIYVKEGLLKGTKKAEGAIEATFKKDYATQNVIAWAKGTVQPDSMIVFTAHYDHLGALGNGKRFAGANDNASGVAMLLELAKHYASNPPPYSVVFMAFSGEEVGLVGSQYYTEHPLFPLGQIRFLINLDLFATGDAGIMAVNGKVFTKEFELLQQVNAKGGMLLPSVQARGEAANSDHYFFHKKGVPSFFFYLMGNWTHYHHIYDAPPVPLTHFSQSFRLITGFADALMGKP